MRTARTTVYLGLFAAMNIILTRFLSIQTPILRIGFGFLPIVFASIMFGPLAGGITAAVADVIGVFIGSSGSYFWGFTISAFLSGIIYGFILYKKKISIVRISAAVVINTIINDIVLNTIWLYMITGKAVRVLIFPRLTKSLIMIPVEIFAVFLLLKYLDKAVKLNSSYNDVI